MMAIKTRKYDSPYASYGSILDDGTFHNLIVPSKPPEKQRLPSPLIARHRTGPKWPLKV